MRDLRFRAWDKEEKEMLSYEDIDASDKDGNLMWGEILNGKHPDIELMQFTGLHDKNGKEIWEGDILSFAGNITADNSLGFEPNGYFYDEDDNHIVVWDIKQACWSLNFNPDEEWKYKRDTHGLMLDSSSIEVIGNVWENPELLKEKP